jgi:MGT family glycosyltransferase
LRERGHEIVCVSTEAARAPVERMGLSFVPVELKARSARAARRRRVRRVLDTFARLIDLTVDELPPVVRRERLELLLFDQSVLGGRTTAELTGLPFVTFIPGLPLRRDRHGRLPPLFAGWPPAATRWARWRNRLAFACVDALAAPLLARLNARRRSRGLRPHRRLDDTFSDAACLTQLPAALEPAGIECTRPFHLVGPLADDADTLAPHEPTWEPPPGGPGLYLSLGTAAPVPGELYHTLLAGSEGLGFARLLSLGGRPRPQGLSAGAGERTWVVPFAPQVRLLQRWAQVAVTHGGLNTVLECLRQGRPMLVVPICDDQPGVAARVEWAGAGLVLPARQATPERVRRALMRLRDEEHFRGRAAALAEQLRAAGGAARAADVVEGVLRAHPHA